MSSAAAAGGESIKVTLRCRPFNKKEAEAGFTKVVNMDPSQGSITITNPKNEADVKTFTFDAVFDERSEQVPVYDSTARQIVDAVLNGFNGTVFVYGQTGTGKTFSMQGVPDVPELRGIIPNAFNHIFNHIARTPQKQFLVRVSFLEIYNEEIRDLLVPGRKSLELKEHPDTGVYVKDLSASVVKSVEEMDKYMTAGNKCRVVGATNMNEQSSRSHSIFTITIESSEKGIDGEDHIVAGKLHLVDLAGSERQSKTGAQGDRLKEAAKINLSLSALGNCISALVDGKSAHIPYRDSKLTRLLQDSLGGNAKTLMIATMSPASYNYDETISTLRYANRAKNIKNKPKINEDPKDALLREYQEEIKRLQELLQRKQSMSAGQSGTGNLSPSEAAPAASPDREKKKKEKRKREKAKAEPTATTATAAATTAESPTQHSVTPPDTADAAADDMSVEDETVADGPLAELDPAMLAHLQTEIEAERKILLATKDLAIDQKERLLRELEGRQAELDKERQQRENLAEQLKELEAKLLVGGVNIAEHVDAQERALEERKLAMLQEEEKQRTLKRALEEKQEVNMALEEHYASLQEEVEAKTRKLQKLWKKLEAAKLEIEDINEEWRNEREDLLSTIRELGRELNLKQSIMESFVPIAEIEKMERQAVFDEENDDWKILPAHMMRAEEIAPSHSADPPELGQQRPPQGDADDGHPADAQPADDEQTPVLQIKHLKRPIASTGFKRPVCLAAKRMMATSASVPPRYYADNMLTIGLFMPERTTMEWADRPRRAASQNLRPASHARSGTGADTDVTDSLSMSALSVKSPRKRDPTFSSGAAQREAPPQQQQYPSARNLLVKSKRYA
ncbi:hypothetical protein RI367_008176 [Sorochytrium milnesiophthora]